MSQHASMMDSSQPTSIILSAFLACLLLALPSGVQGQNTCVAGATASSGELGAVADAVANSVAATLTKDIDCVTGELVDPGPNGNGLGLSIALALAISVAEEIGQNCSSTAEAEAGELTAKVLGTEVSQALGRVSTPGADKVIMARAAALQDEVTKSAETENSGDLAERIAREIIEAATNILSELKCDKDEPTPSAGDCVFINGQFLGNCISSSARREEIKPVVAKSKRSAGPELTVPPPSPPPPRRGCSFVFGQLLC